MSDAARILLCLAFAGGLMALLQRLAMALALGKLTKPQCLLGDALAAMVGLQLSALFLLLTARPVVATLLTLAVGALLVSLNRCKEIVLREPLVLADAWLLGQVVRYPHLYLPFFPVRMLAVCASIFCLLLVLLIGWETTLAVYSSFGTVILLLCLAGLPSLLLFMMRHGYCRALGACLQAHGPVGHDAVRDAALNGPLASALLHPVACGLLLREKAPALFSVNTRPPGSHWPESLQRILDVPPNDAPHVLLVQAESFTDIRTTLPARQQEVLRDFLPNWDALCRTGHNLPTPDKAFGAYTMRTEFSMLTGLKAEDLGPCWFNPYLLAARRPMWSLARHFTAQGYGTLCLHPYAGDFFARNRVMPNLGFSRFEDLSSLSTLSTFGPYVSDLALAHKVLEILHQSDKPLFCFVITMESHGPWLPGRLTEQQIAGTLHGVDRSLFSPEMQQYLCHLRHMDTMLGILGGNTQDAPGKDEDKPLQKPRRTLVWAYGDHAPGI